MPEKTKLQNLLDFIYEIDYALTPSETMIVQKQRNELKYNLLEAFVDVLIEAGLPEDLIHRTTDGYIFELQNVEHGRIPIQIDVKVKNMDYLLEEAAQEWKDKIRDKKDKEAKAKKDAAEKERRKQERLALQEKRKATVMAEYEEYKNKS